MRKEAVNKNAQPCVKKVLEYLAGISGDRVITGQHTQTIPMEELQKIKKVTGKEPALLGFELLAYSPNINEEDTDEACMREVIENRDTLKCAYDWAEKKGLITFTWHWFSPLGGRSKAFYTEHTDYDVEKAVTPGTVEYDALVSDMDHMASILKPFSDKGIPILWRPFHEMDGTWFWWGSKGAEPAKKLWHIMYERFTSVHDLTDLIWVWNAGSGDFYPGDDVVDIVSVDIYPPEHEHTARKEEFLKMESIPGESKIILLGEIGVLPDVDAIHNEKIGWASFMIWSKEFCLTEDYSTDEYLKHVYDSPYSITKEDLPVLY